MTGFQWPDEALQAAAGALMGRGLRAAPGVVHHYAAVEGRAAMRALGLGGA